MATPHKNAGRSIKVVSALPVEQLVNLCKDAADQCKLRLEGVKPGQLIFSVRGLVRPEKNKLMVFEVRLARCEDKLTMKSHILSYRTSQSKYLGLIPMEPRKLVGLQSYDNFIRRFEELVSHSDPGAKVTIDE